MREFSAGGVVIKNKSVLLIKVKNLSKKIVWTLPKGHIEKNETEKDAALREVLEETGCICEIIKPLGTTQYRFKRQNESVNKKVAWFLMSPLSKIKKHELGVLVIKWIKIDKTKNYLKYPLDKKLLLKAGSEVER